MAKRFISTRHRGRFIDYWRDRTADLELTANKMDGRIVELEKEIITQLRADLARWEAKGTRMFEREHRGKMDAIDTLTKTLKPLLKDMKEIKADLSKFGGHTWDCQYRVGHDEDDGSPIEGESGECDCGYAKARERWE